MSESVATFYNSKIHDGDASVDAAFAFIIDSTLEMTNSILENLHAKTAAVGSGYDAVVNMKNTTIRNCTLSKNEQDEDSNGIMNLIDSELTFDKVGLTDYSYSGLNLEGGNHTFNEFTAQNGIHESENVSLRCKS